MNKKKTPEFDPTLMASVPPEKREDFKKLARKQRYLGSGLFLFLWHLLLWCLSFLIIELTLGIFESAYAHLKELFSVYTSLLLSFFLGIILSYLSRGVRQSLNQVGIHAVHFGLFAFFTLFVAWWWIATTPARGY